jgi:hypothetical protein
MEDTSLNERISQMLTGPRVVLPGAQALLGFQLISLIIQSFDKLRAKPKLVPRSKLRLHYRDGDSPDGAHLSPHRLLGTRCRGGVGSWFVTCATIPLAFGLAGDVCVVLTEITASARIGASIAGVALVFLVGLWHVFPVVVRLRRDQ